MIENMQDYLSDEEKEEYKIKYPFLKFSPSTLKCDCGGELEQSNEYYTTNPPKFIHRCKKCFKLIPISIGT